VCIHNDNQRGCDSREQHEMVLLFFCFLFYIYRMNLWVNKDERKSDSSSTSTFKKKKTETIYTCINKDVEEDV